MKVPSKSELDPSWDATEAHEDREDEVGGHDPDGVGLQMNGPAMQEYTVILVGEIIPDVHAECADRVKYPWLEISAAHAFHQWRLVHRNVGLCV